MPIESIVPAKANLLGEKECTYGPSFWCATRENAEKCKVSLIVTIYVTNVVLISLDSFRQILTVLVVNL